MTDGREHDLLADVVDRWRGRRVIVVGDVMLDEWRYTEPQRLYREAATPVFALRRHRDAAGGAGNTAANLAALGARPVLVSAVGDDEAGRRLRTGVADAGVEDLMVTVPAVATLVKRRVVAADQIVLCEEDGVGGPLPAAVDGLLRALHHAGPGSGSGGSPPVLVVCDFGKGVLHERVRRYLVAHRREFGTVVVDARDPGRWAALRPTAVTPSYAEAAPLLGPPGYDDPRDRAAVVAERAPELLRRTGARLAAVTLDGSGAVVVSDGDDPYRTRTQPVPPGRTVGAGDAYTACLTLALAAGAAVPEAAELAQLAAAAAVTETGTCLCTRTELLAAIADHPDHHAARVVDPAALAELVQHRRDRGARIVFTNGCFDVLHRGHVRYLSQARQLGDMLIVAVNSDASVRRLKGPERPVNALEDRVAVLAALSCVDLVVVFEDDSPVDLITAVRPDVYVKGGDYNLELLPEAPLVQRLGGEVRMLDYVPDRSTSAIIERIRSRKPVPEQGRPDASRRASSTTG